MAPQAQASPFMVDPRLKKLQELSGPASAPTTVSNPSGFAALTRPPQMTHLQKLMHLFNSMRQPYGQDVRQKQLGSY